MKTGRRNFIKISSVAGAGIITAGLASVNSLEKDITIVSPVDGDMLNENDGIVADGCLVTTVKILASSDSIIKVNDIEAKYEGGLFLADVCLKDYRNNVEVVEKSRGHRQSIIVYWLKNYTNKYRLSLDDNIWFLKDISNNANKYKSIFENPYLAFFKQVHDTYGTKIHFNIYYQTDGFNLSQMTDKFKNEWKENAGWLRLSFHALQDEPDNPYINAGYNEVKKDCEMVMEQVKRFAGEEVTGPVTTLHWAEATVEGCRALKDAGFSVLLGVFNVENLPIGYYLDAGKRYHLNRRFIWRDNREGIIFVKFSMCFNNYKLEEIVPFLDELKKDPHKSGFIELVAHEQYFYPSYYEYQPDIRQKALASVKWATDNGYEPAFLSECILD